MSAAFLRSLGRQRAVQALFSLEAVSEEGADEGLAQFWASLEESTPGPARRFAEQLVRGVISCRDELDRNIQEQSPAWRIERMAKVDRNVLRIGAWELLYSDTPARVVINEAIENARTFGAEGSPAFVNGVLDKLAREAGRL